MPYTPEPLATYTFKNGAIATIHTVGAMTIAHVTQGAEKKIPQVAIPVFTVDMGDGPTEQPNPTDPAYQAAVARRRGLVNLTVMDALIELAVDIAIDRAALDRVNTTMEMISMPLDEISEKVAYVKHCCITDGSELGDLGALIRGDIEEAVEAATATFSDHVPAAGTDTLELTPIGHPV